MGEERKITLKDSEREQLKEMRDTPGRSRRERNRAQVLLLSDAGWSRSAIVTATGTSTSTISRVRRQYQEHGLETALEEKARPGATRKMSPRQMQELVALACCDPPTGYGRWSLALLLEQAQSKGIIGKMSREPIRLVLKEHGLKPWREKNVVHSEGGQRLCDAHGRCAGAV